MATRCMQQAVYFSSGTIAHELYYHYGLACPIYTHFTSPIRRYADVVVHRLLAASIGADQTHASILDTKYAVSLCDNLNYRHRQAQYAGRASVAMNTHEHMQICQGVTLKTFDEITVRLTLDSTNLQHRKLVFQLVEPFIAGFSYVDDKKGDIDIQMTESNVNVNETVTDNKQKRKVDEMKTKKKKSKK
ncbi:unnamed protein product [Leptidea sinapis]|uniref:RNB domain-containing protein n=1 Tax=Leptidea sinapis TaxID=189913 RepID=A0A5E4PQB0_9NEOP|nr:unnamed protein product [Leptidea sinapis]